MDLLIDGINPHADFISIPVKLWGIWHARRKALHENDFQSSQGTHFFVQIYLSDLKVCKTKHQPRQEAANTPVHHPRWIPPVQGIAKIHVDGVVSRSSSKGSISVVCRNSVGDYLGSSVMVCPGIVDPIVL